ncbi:MAG: hypothetical protein LBK82_09120 [Planctomycetaceae bacterium]|nr:hypothetical protein [Planctomycetaceae bacterium]
MNSEKEKTSFFGFGQLRFVIGTILFLAAGLKAYQLSTVPLPPPVQNSVFTPLLEFLNNRYLLMFVVESEILFALFLFSGIGRQWTWFFSLVGFFAFLIVSAIKGLSGENSCGCFGVVTINPWITATFDLIIVILLIIFREHCPFNLNLRLNLSKWEKQKFLLIAVIWIVLAVPALLSMLSLKQVHAILGTEMTTSAGTKKIVLEPATWKGKEFPLIARFTQPADGEILKQGTWTILLIHSDCPKCRKLISDKENQNNTNIALVEIPSSSTEDLPKISFPVFKLDENNEWFAVTPCIIVITDGICVSITENP